MVNFIYQILRTARPRQWLKNFSLFAAPIFSGMLFSDDVFYRTFIAFIVFCGVSSGVYFFNDIVDAPKDKLHPIKKNRPIPSGKISLLHAKIITLILWSISLYFAFNAVGSYFGYIALIYVLLQLAYSLYFKNVIIIESLFVASGFILRVFAGGLASESSISSWLVLTTIGLSLLLAFGKRRSEKTILAKHMGKKDKTEIVTRKTLRHYPDTLLDSMISMSSTFCIITYALFTFQVSPQSVNQSLLNILPSILRSPKWMMLTIPIVIYGVARYLYVIYEKEEGESPERILLKDKPLLGTVVAWGLSVLAIIYFI